MHIHFIHVGYLTHGPGRVRNLIIYFATMEQKTVFLPSWLHFWSRKLHNETWPGFHVYFSLIRKFLRAFDVLDKPGLASLKRQPCIYLANHQTYVESIIFNAIGSALGDRVILALAKVQHMKSWVGQLYEICFSYPGLQDPGLMQYIDQDEPGSFPVVLKTIKDALNNENKSLLIHVDGTRRNSVSQDRVLMLSSFWTDFAVENGFPIIPVRFIGGLPVEDHGIRYDFPVGYTAQTFRIGRPILPGDLIQLTAETRNTIVRRAINGLASPEEKIPEPADELFALNVKRWAEHAGVAESIAAIFQTMNYYQPDEKESLSSGDQRFDDFIQGLIKAGRLSMANASEDVALIVPDSEEGKWMARFAAFLYGSRGPKVFHSQEASKGFKTRVWVEEARI